MRLFLGDNKTLCVSREVSEAGLFSQDQHFGVSYPRHVEFADLGWDHYWSVWCSSRLWSRSVIIER